MSRKSWFLLGAGTGHLFFLSLGVELSPCGQVDLDQIFGESVALGLRGAGALAGAFFFWSLLKFRRFRAEQIILALFATGASLWVLEHHSRLGHDSKPDATVLRFHAEPVIADECEAGQVAACTRIINQGYDAPRRVACGHLRTSCEAKSVAWCTSYLERCTVVETNPFPKPLEI